MILSPPLICIIVRLKIVDRNFAGNSDRDSIEKSY
jgi:hypothetical protein